MKRVSVLAVAIVLSSLIVLAGIAYAVTCGTRPYAGPETKTYPCGPLTLTGYNCMGVTFSECMAGYVQDISFSISSTRNISVDLVEDEFSSNYTTVKCGLDTGTERIISGASVGSWTGVTAGTHTFHILSWPEDSTQGGNIVIWIWSNDIYYFGWMTYAEPENPEPCEGGEDNTVCEY